MNVIQGLLQAVSPLPDGDFSDRLNYCYTTTALIVASAFVSGWSFVGQPIQCWFPAYYRGWWIEYAIDYCYVQNTYFLPFTEVKPNSYWEIAEHVVPIPKNHTERDERMIGYYQWVPFILALQAILFFLPIVLWRSLYSATGVKVKAICDTCSIKANLAADERKKNMEVVARFITYQHEINEHLGGRIRTSLSGRFIVSIYLLIKVIYAINALAQFLMLKQMLGVKNLWWGLDVAFDLATGNEWPMTGNFPRVTMCDFAVRVLGNLHRHSVQCVLMINMFNEKIFLGLWFWLVIVAIVSITSMIYWIGSTIGSRTGERMVNSYIEKIDPTVARSNRRRQALNVFVRDKLRPDGVFLLRLVQANSGDVVTCDLISALWAQHIRERPFDSLSTSPPPYSEPLLISKKDLIDESDL